jgi:transketolase
MNKAHLDIEELKDMAQQIRRHVIRTVTHAGAGHIGGPLSAAEMLACLFFSELNIDPQNPQWEDRDRLVLSKGHSAIALYAVMAERGYFPVDELMTFDAIDSRLQAHPDMTVTPGIDMSTGSLGQGLSAGIGMALAARLSGKAYRTYVILGDGETQEGQVWEAVTIAARYRLDNLCALLDWNGVQQYGLGWPFDNDQAPIDNPVEKLRVFGWHVIRVDGHNVEQILNALAESYSIKGKPTFIVADTIKGKGVSFMENTYQWHVRVPSHEEMEIALTELESKNQGGRGK